MYTMASTWPGHGVVESGSYRRPIRGLWNIAPTPYGLIRVPAAELSSHPLLLPVACAGVARIKAGSNEAKLAEIFSGRVKDVRMRRHSRPVDMLCG